MYKYCERIHGQDLNCQKQMNQHEMVDFIDKAHVIRYNVALHCSLLAFECNSVIYAVAKYHRSWLAKKMVLHVINITANGFRTIVEGIEKIKYAQKSIATY